MMLGKTKQRTPVVRSRKGGAFHLVQRLQLAPHKQFQERCLKAKISSNPFGAGRMGDYELDYMGAAEFEFGAVTKANNRLAKAGNDLVLTTFEFAGHTLDLLYIGAEGSPIEAWVDWAEGRYYFDDSAPDGEMRRETPFDGKEPPSEFRQRLAGKEPWDKERGWRTHIWWALDANVLWSFAEDGHMQRWIESMATAPTEFLR